MKLSIGDRAPAFSAKDQNGDTISLSSLKGKNIILYFYPKDLTPGCTQEACDFRDLTPKFKKKNTVILGVSMDSQERHLKFAEKYDLNFSLLSDVDGEICKAYGVYGKKRLYGREYMGIFRTTFTLDKMGKITKIYEKVKVKGHSDLVLKEI